MARKDDKEAQLRRLKRYALADDQNKLEEYLLYLLKLYPENDFLKEELLRLREGKTLQVLETKEEREQREKLRLQEELKQLYVSYISRRSNWSQLTQDQLKTYITALDEFDSEENARSFRKSLQRELSRRAARTLKRRLILAGCLILLTTLTAYSIHRYNAAFSKMRALETALRAQNWQLVEEQLKNADNALDLLMSTQLRSMVNQARNWKSLQEEKFCRLQASVERWKKEPQTFADMHPMHKAQFENELAELAYPHESLRKDWDLLEESHREQLMSRLSDVKQELAKPLPTAPVLTGDLAADAAALRLQEQTLQERISLYEGAIRKFPLEEALIQPARDELRHNRAIQADLKLMQELLKFLPTAQSYKHYRSLISKYTPTVYTPGVRWLTDLSTLPQQQNLLNVVRDRGGNIPHQTLVATLLDGKPSFTAEYPATRKQTAYMEPIFTSVPLREVFYILTNSKGEWCISQKEPRIAQIVKGHVDAEISRSTYDPAYNPMEPSLFVWNDAASIMKTTLDATPLMKATGIRRDTFFGSVNIPRLLDTIINTDAPQCPPLARAFLFNAVLQVAISHPQRELMGIPYSPSLQKDITTFLSIIKRGRATFQDGMWLTVSPQNDWLNETYGRWFRERKGKSYAAEMAANFRELIDVRPRFAGYVGTDGELILCSRQQNRLTQGSRLWYIRKVIKPDLNQAEEATPFRGADSPRLKENTASQPMQPQESELSIGTYGIPLEDALPLSPIFTVEKDGL